MLKPIRLWSKQLGRQMQYLKIRNIRKLGMGDNGDILAMKAYISILKQNSA